MPLFHVFVLGCGLQYEVKYPTGITCQGSYLKLISTAETGDVSPSSPYVIMFGPDKCG